MSNEKQRAQLQAMAAQMRQRNSSYADSAMVRTTDTLDWVNYLLTAVENVDPLTEYNQVGTMTQHLYCLWTALIGLLESQLDHAALAYEFQPDAEFPACNHCDEPLLPASSCVLSCGHVLHTYCIVADAFPSKFYHACQTCAIFEPMYQVLGEERGIMDEAVMRRAIGIKPLFRRMHVHDVASDEVLFDFINTFSRGLALTIEGLSLETEPEGGGYVEEVVRDYHLLDNMLDCKLILIKFYLRLRIYRDMLKEKEDARRIEEDDLLLSSRCG